MRQEWSDDELTVLLGIFISRGFSLGDDSQDSCRAIANQLGRSPSAVDRQWRNLKHHLFRLDLYGVNNNIGTNVMTVVDRYRCDLGTLRREALDLMDAHGWHLRRFIEENSAAAA